MTDVVTSVSFVTESVVSFTSLTCGIHGSDLPTTIMPSSSLVTAILASRATPDTEPAGFALSSSFAVGDVVEVHDQDAGGNSGAIFDENGNQVAGNVTLGVGVLMRKVATGTGRTWSRIG